MFKVGQKVICKVFGEGVVTEVDFRTVYPIEVSFLSGDFECYTEGGKMYEYDYEPRLSVIEEWPV